MTSAIALLGVLAGGLTAALAATLWRSKRQQGALARAALAEARAREAHRELAERERKESKALEASREELEAVKHELAAQKKKNHLAQEDMKKLRAQLHDKDEEMMRARHERPAFESKPRAEVKVVKSEPRPESKPDPAPALAAELTAELLAQRERLRELGALHEGLLQRVGAAEQGHHEARAELLRVRKRIEDYRRIDLVSKGRVAVLEDRLRNMGRQYYDAVSELAVLKGEVQPPAPRDLPPEQDDASELAGADSREATPRPE